MTRRGRLGRYLDDLRTLPGDIRIAFRTRGWPGVAFELKDRTLHRLYRRGRFYVFEQDLTDVRLQPTPEGVVIRELTASDLPDLSSIVTRRKLQRTRELLDLGRICIGAWVDGRMVGYTWTSRRMERQAEFYELPMPDDAVYMWDLFVLPSQRGGGIGSALVAARLAHARRLGYRKAWRIVSPLNRPAMRTFQKSVGNDFRLLWELRSVKILSRARTTLHAPPEHPQLGDPPRR